MGYGKRLNQAMIERKSSRAWLATEVGVSVQALSSALIEHTNAFKADNHEKAARAPGISGLWLAMGEGEMTLSIEFPFTLFTYEEFMRIPPEQREQIEDQIAGAVLRHKKAA